MKLSRNLILVFLLVVALLSSAYDSQHALTNQIVDIEASLKQLQTLYARPELTISSSSYHGPKISYNDKVLQSVLAKMKKATIDLEAASAEGPSDVLTDASSRYLSALAEIHMLYARKSHLPGEWTSKYDFESLAPYRLHLHEKAALPVILQKPFNSRHADADHVEFFVTAEENQMAEFLALSSPKTEYDYEALIQFVSVREAYVNRWGLQRLSYSPLPSQAVNSCAPDLLSFRTQNGDTKSSDASLQLNAIDRYNGLTAKLNDTFEATRDFSLAPSGEYYAILTRLFSSTPEFKTYIQGIPPKQVSIWLKTAADAIAKSESEDWLTDSENSKKILGASTLIGDNLSSQAIAVRMAQSVSKRHQTAAAAQIEKIATGNLQIKESPALHDSIDAALQIYESASVTALAPKLVPSLKDLDSPVDSKKQTSDRIQAKITELTAIAESLMPAVHDDLLIRNAGPIAETKEEENDSLRSKDPKVYIHDEFQYVIADSTTLKSHLLTQQEHDSSLWRKLNDDPAIMKIQNQFLLDLDSSSAQAINQLGPNASRAQVSAKLLSVAQTGAEAALASLAKIPDSQALLRRSFETIHLLSAKTPQDLSPTTDSQRDLIQSAISRAYELDPILGVKWKRSGFLKENKSLLYYIQDEALSNGKINPEVTRLTLEALQHAVANDQGKLEDFCQANLHDTKHDQKFRNMFLSATHLRQIIGHTNDPTQSAQLKKFDDDLTTQTETKQEALMNHYVDPALTGLFVATMAVIVIGFAGPASIAAALPIIMAILNLWMMAPLSAVSLYLRLSSNFYEKPAQLKYQDAIASSQVSAKDPFNDWEQLKKLGLLSNTTDRETVDKNHSALAQAQFMAVASLPMDIWYGESIVSGARSSMGITGMIKMRELFNGEIPAFANIVKPPVAPTFREIADRSGVMAAIKQKSAAAVDQIKVISGLKPVVGMFTAQEGVAALKAGLARAMPSELESMLPEIRLYKEFLAARLKTTQAVAELGADTEGAEATIVVPAVGEEAPSEVTEATQKALTEAPELKGRLSWKEGMENPQLAKFMLIPKSAFQAVREGRFAAWVKNYGNMIKQVNELRVDFVARKLESFTALESKVSQAVSRHVNAEQLLADLTEDELVLIEEAAHGPQWLAYGYWSAKLANFRLSASPLKGLLSVFDDYHEMLRSLRPLDWAPQNHPGPAASTDEEDLRNYYQTTRARDAGENTTTPDASDLESKIEQQLYHR